MANTLYLNLTELTSQGAGAEIRYNFMQAIFDAFLGSGVVSATTAAQPGSPTAEQIYILPVGATGAQWGGGTHDKQLAALINSSWYFVTPREGWTFYDQLNNEYVKYDGTNWVRVATLQAHTKTLTILNPTAAENIGMCFFKRASKIRRLNAVIRSTSGTASVTWNLKVATSRNAAGTSVMTSNQVTTSVTTGDEVTSFSTTPFPVPAGSFLWFITSAIGAAFLGTIEITVEFTEDA